jgi:photosystem II stability/assembly factor-like uncharacterized protein
MGCLVAASVLAGSVIAAEPGHLKSAASQATARSGELRPQIRVVEGGESQVKPDECRATLVGPSVNPPDPFPGYGGFVGWESPIRLRNGVWLVGFNAGYWHASAPTPLHYPAKTLEEYHKLGLPADIVAPTGGRALLIRSTDEGKTWSKPVTLIDTPADDRHPAFVELRDGTILCSFFTYVGEPENGDLSKAPELAARVHITRSFNGGRTWEQKPRTVRTPFLYDETDGPFVRLKDGSVLIAINGRPRSGPPDQAAVLRSTNRGKTWKLLSTIKADHDLQEITVAELPARGLAPWDKRGPDGAGTRQNDPTGLVLMARAEGDICWSEDHGHTWTPPVTFGMRMYAPSLYVLRDGTLVCLHGSYAPGHGGLRVIFSTDGGRTWIAPAKDHGFLVDQAYGYGKAMELPDGSLFITYLATGGHRTEDARNNAIRCIRLRVRADPSGIDLLPAPNR